MRVFIMVLWGNFYILIGDRHELDQNHGFGLAGWPWPCP